MRPVIKDNGMEYWEYTLCYVNDVLVISNDPGKTMRCIKSQFKLKGNKAEEPEVYLGASLSKMENEFGNLCWAMSLDKYCAALVNNVEEMLAKKGLRLPSKCVTPILHRYCPEMDATGKFMSDGVQWIKRSLGHSNGPLRLGALISYMKYRYSQSILPCQERDTWSRLFTWLDTLSHTRR